MKVPTKIEKHSKLEKKQENFLLAMYSLQLQGIKIRRTAKGCQCPQAVRRHIF